MDSNYIKGGLAMAALLGWDSSSEFFTAAATNGKRMFTFMDRYLFCPECLFMILICANKLLHL